VAKLPSTCFCVSKAFLKLSTTLYCFRLHIYCFRLLPRDSCLCVAVLASDTSLVALPTHIKSMSEAETPSKIREAHKKITEVT
jgi:hypothetical protein